MSSVLLLKKNGTLWRWGVKTDHWTAMPSHWQGFRAEAPHQLDTSSDWLHLLQLSSAAAQKKDGSVWRIRSESKLNKDILMLDTNLTRAGFANAGLDDRKVADLLSEGAGIRSDGTLWVWGDQLYGQSTRHFQARQCSIETNWTAIAMEMNTYITMVALKSDGTLWRLGAHLDSWQPFAERFTRTPERLGSHDDWVALMPTWDGVVSLAADGSLWLWPGENDYRGQYRNLALIEPSQKPIRLGNILATK